MAGVFVVVLLWWIIRRLEGEEVLKSESGSGSQSLEEGEGEEENGGLHG